MLTRNIAFAVVILGAASVGVVHADVMRYQSKYGARLTLNSKTHQANFSQPCAAVPLKYAPHFSAPYTFSNGRLTLHGKTSIQSLKPPYAVTHVSLNVHFITMPNGGLKEVAPFPTSAEDIPFHGMSCQLGLSNPYEPLVLSPLRR